MGKILCATRGGEQSFRTQDSAIDLALANQDHLTFIYVVNIDFLKKTRRAVRPEVVATEIEKMGIFLLEMAQERARQRGVESDIVLYRGNLREQLRAAVRDQSATAVVLGKPAGVKSFFALQSLQSFVTKLEAETGAKAYIF